MDQLGRCLNQRDYSGFFKVLVLLVHSDRTAKAKIGSAQKCAVSPGTLRQLANRVAASEVERERLEVGEGSNKLDKAGSEWRFADKAQSGPTVSVAADRSSWPNLELHSRADPVGPSCC